MRNYKVDIDGALDRAMKSLDMSMMAKNLDVNETGLSEAQRTIRAAVGQGYAQLAIALQAERDWEDRKIKEIKKGE